MSEFKSYDVIKGYRADDSYFSLAQLEKAMALGSLGEQVVLRSQKAFDSLTFTQSMPAPRAIYFPKKLARDIGARTEFKQKNKAERRK